MIDTILFSVTLVPILFAGLLVYIAITEAYHD
jgi:hypothetical protein